MVKVTAECVLPDFNTHGFTLGGTLIVRFEIGDNIYALKNVYAGTSSETLNRDGREYILHYFIVMDVQLSTKWKLELEDDFLSEKGIMLTKDASRELWKGLIDMKFERI